jgi:hypothetical protein
VNKTEPITITLTNNQAVHLWAVLAGYAHDMTNDLKRRGIFKSDGTPNKRQKHYSELEQQLLDNLTITELVYKHLEGTANFSQVLRQTQLKAAEGGEDD